LVVWLVIFICYFLIGALIEDLLPNMASYVFMAFVLLMSSAMIAEPGLSMIGLGVTKGVSLGIILYWAQLRESVHRGIWWWFVPPDAYKLVKKRRYNHGETVMYCAITEVLVYFSIVFALCGVLGTIVTLTLIFYPILWFVKHG